MKTAWAVYVSDVVATRVIRIIAVGLVFLFLLAVAVPLFFHARVESSATVPSSSSEPLPCRAVDESRTLAWVVTQGGMLRVFRLDNGEIIAEQALVSHSTVTSASAGVTDHVALGLADGSVVVGTIRFLVEFMVDDELTDAAKQLPPGGLLTSDGCVIHRTDQGQVRRLQVVADLQKPVTMLTDPIAALDYLPPAEGGSTSMRAHRIIAASHKNHSRICEIREKKNTLTRQTKQELTWRELPDWNHTSPLTYVLLSSRGDFALRIGKDGLLQRLQLGETMQVVEQVPLVPEGVSLTVCGWILGRETLFCGDDRGQLQGWFRAPASDAVTSDGQRMALAHRLGGSSVAPTSYCPSQRSRMVAVGFADGTLQVYHMTSEKLVMAQPIVPGEPLQHVMISPRDDGLLVFTKSSLWHAEFHPRHPEVTWGTLFLPVWYEGYEGPLHTWQSSAATSASEMKLGLFSLVFGTLKATFYTMVFSAPIALLAAIYTSEFIPRGIRARIKPCIEMMASLPSVVLGFLAAIVFAPYAEAAIVSLLLAILVIPLTFALGGYLWQLLPRAWTLRLAPYRLWALFAIMPCGAWMAYAISWPAEHWFFAGSVGQWLDGQVGSGSGGGMLLLFPLCLAVVAYFAVARLNPWMRSRAQGWSRSTFALVDLVKFLACLLLALGLALGAAWAFEAMGWDPRVGPLAPYGTYEQRNSLIVAFVMGFAVIPIIYTIADDALHAVPNHLRSASLGAGATKWQTALRIVLPTAMSGLFSALMVGLGRAVGETMIVLMAGGNTPILDPNMFNGFRTMSANVATELPEAVRDSTHYRTLFLSALTLFALTFLVNTIAEIVRLRFRRRAVQL
ncbi:MAG: ABC transporter permease subunit [Planctomycetota bacterium]|nr:ABC transporter permease subunit [Planctomycetota bacterium]